MSINLRELKRQFELLGPEQTVSHLEEALENKALKPDDFSVRDLCEALCGTEYLRSISDRKSGRTGLKEAASAVDTSAFSNITGQIVYTKVKDAYEANALIADLLCTTMPTTFINGEKIPGISELSDEAEIVDEGATYPTVGLSEEYVEAPATVKRGFLVPVTREIIISDRTGLLLQRAAGVGKVMAINKEKRIIDVATGQTNNYKRNGTALNTYLTSGAYINKLASGNALVDWTDVENLELLFDAITDPNTGEPIVMTNSPLTLIVPSALKRTALRLVNATDIRFGDGASNTTAAYGKNPLSGDGISVVSNAYVKARTSSATKWFAGRPKEAFMYSEVWGIEIVQAPQNNSGEFYNDIMQCHKVSERGVAWVYEPRYMTESNA